MRCQAKSAAVGQWARAGLVIFLAGSFSTSLSANSPPTSGVRTVPQSGPGAAARGASSGVAPGSTAVQPTAVKYVPISFADVPGWAEDDHLAAFKAFRISCPKVVATGAETAKGTGKGTRLAPSPDLIAACQTALRLPAKVTRTAARAFFEAHFTAERVVHAAPGPTPTFTASAPAFTRS